MKTLNTTFRNWKRKLSTRSLVLFHDTNARDAGFGVYKFWSELKETFPFFEFYPWVRSRHYSAWRRI